ncbi:TetR/AcrR family transcriptional regulator [Nocardia pneumoniae]|uniref:TetR/AcrR family transcriptional regulator n=1 Tax=Nocardia pneumoniae TaxID=228601 RepID=UPI0002E08792|nr:TetR/AcrR family transcriptional regulator [Nocardia pneumoniae]
MIAEPTSPVSPKNEDDSVESRILDAALVQFEKVGVKKTTIEDVARQAGVDRVTVYRRVGSRDDLVRAVVSREVGAVLAEVAQIPDRHDNIADLVADIFVTVLTRWRNHSLVHRMLTIEPDRMITKLTTEGATTFAMSVATAAAALERAIERELLPETPDVTARAEVVCRVVHSLILAPDGGMRLDSDSEMNDFARKYLLPIIVC